MVGKIVDTMVIDIKMTGITEFEKNIKRLQGAVKGVELLESMNMNKNLLGMFKKIGVGFDHTKKNAGKFIDTVGDGSGKILEFGDVLQRVQDKLSPKKQKQFSDEMKKLGKNTDDSKNKMTKFNMEQLGVMFGFMALQKAMNGLLQPAMQSSGLFEEWGYFLEDFFEPVMNSVLDAITPIIDWFDSWEDSSKLVAGALAILISILITYKFVMAQVALFTNAVTMVNEKKAAQEIKNGKSIGLLDRISEMFSMNEGKRFGKRRKGIMSLGTSIVGLGLGAFMMTGAFDDLFANILDALDPIIEPFTELAYLIGDFIGALLEDPTGTLKAIWDGIIILFTMIWQGIKDIFNAGWQWIKDNVFAPITEWIATNVTPVWEAFKKIITDTWDGIKNAISKAWNWIKDNIFTPITTAISNMITNTWEKLKTTVTDVWDGIKKKISDVWDIIKPIWDKIVTAFGSVLGNPFKAVSDGLGVLWNAFKSLFDWLDSKSKGMLSGAISWVMNQLKGIFKMADGGIVTSPTIAMVGEAGPEAVIPLDKMGSMGTNIGNVNININVSGTSGMNERQLADKIGDVVMQKFRNTITR